MLTPRQYQISGINWLTQKNVKLNEQAIMPVCARHILSDAPGAGKSAQSIWASEILLKEAADRGMPSPSCMIFCPAHLAKQWFDYFLEHFPQYRVIWLEGSRTQRQRDAAKAATFYIVSIQSLRQQYYYDMLVQLYIDQHVQCTIIDESHYVKNRDAITSQRARTITRPEFCPHVILLTATPVCREADDLYMQLRICDPLSFHRFDLFMNVYCWFTLGGWGYSNVVLRTHASEALSNWLWGRTYKDIGLELPPVVSYIEKHDLSSQRRKVYDDLKYSWYAQFTSSSEPLTASSAMEVMHTLRRLTASDDKAKGITEYLDSDPGPYLVAVSYKLSARLVSVQMKQAGYNPVIIDGDVPADDRRTLCTQATDPKDVIIATIPSISEGVDLSHCNSVYFFEEDWTPGKHYQFLSRVRRHRNNTNVGVVITEDNKLHVEIDPNEKPIIVRYFHANKTIDTHIHAVQNDRSVSVQSIIKVELGL